MKTTLLIFTTILLNSCAEKKFYTVCPVAVPNAWKRPPAGGLQYRQIKDGIYACTKNGVCRFTKSDFKILAENMQKCEHARQGLVDLYDALSGPQLRDEFGQIYKKDPVIDITPPEQLLPDDSKKILRELENTQVDSRSP